MISNLGRLTATAVLLMPVTALSACGGSDAAGEAVDPSSYPSEVVEGSTLKIYSWADYISPDTIQAFEEQTGVEVQVDAYASAEEAVAKLRLTQGTSGYDLVVMDGSYVPQLVEGGSLLKWDRDRLPGFAGLSPTFVGRSWDPTNTYAIPKSGGSTGYVWDSAVVTTAPETWNDFYDTFDDPGVDGRTSVVDGAPSLVSSYFWGNDISDRTTEDDDYAAAEEYFDSTVLDHLKEFNSYPRAELASGDVVLAQAFTGDARGALIDGPDTLRFALGAPRTDIYVDHWVLPVGSENIAAAHAFVQLVLEPKHAAQETAYHGYYTGVEASRDELPADLPFPEIVFFDDGVPADRFVEQEVTEARRQSVATFQRLKALASQ